MLQTDSRVFYGKFNAFVIQGIVAFSEGYHKDLMGKHVDESWDSIGTTKKRIYRFLTKKARAIVSLFDEPMI